MRVKERIRQEIEEKLGGMGDYVKMDYLLNCLKNDLDFETRRFVFVKLTGLYEDRKMFSDAAKMMLSAAEMNTLYQNKINDFVKSCDLYIKAGNYKIAETVMKKALEIANEKQKEEVKNSIIEFFKTRGKSFSDNNKRKHAVDVYEHLLDLQLNESEKGEIREKLSKLYENLGRIRDYYRVRKQI